MSDDRDCLGPSNNIRSVICWNDGNICCCRFGDHQVVVHCACQLGEEHGTRKIIFGDVEAIEAALVPGKKPSDAPPPPVPYKCGGKNDGPPPTIQPTTTTPEAPGETTEPTTTTTPGDSSGPNLNAPTNRREIEHPGSGQKPISSPTKGRNAPSNASGPDSPQTQPLNINRVNVDSMENRNRSCSRGGGGIKDLFCGFKHDAVCGFQLVCDNSFDNIADTAVMGNNLTGQYEQNFRSQFGQFKDAGYSREQLQQMAMALALQQVEYERMDQHNQWKTENKNCKSFSRLYNRGQDRCEGPVAVCGPKEGPETPEEARQRLDYIGRANTAIHAPLVRVETKGPLRRAATNSANRERAAHPERYTNGLVAGHVPDTTWGKSRSARWLPTDDEPVEFVNRWTGERVPYRVCCHPVYLRRVGRWQVPSREAVVGGRN